MWYVYNVQDTWMCGWTVESREEAIAQCKADSELTFCYIG